jgi:hypothetical protein
VLLVTAAVATELPPPFAAAVAVEPRDKRKTAGSVVLSRSDIRTVVGVLPSTGDIADELELLAAADPSASTSFLASFARHLAHTVVRLCPFAA